MDGLKKLLDSSTFLLAALAFGVHYASGGTIPLDLLMTAVGIYGVKETGRYLGAGFAGRPEAPKPGQE